MARGGPWVDLEVFGTGLDRYETGFPESLALLRTWLSGTGQVSADGPQFRFRPVSVVPRPARTTPLWIAATSETTAGLAAAVRVPLLLGMHAATSEIRAVVRRYQVLAAGLPAPHARAHLAYVADTTRQAQETLQASMPGWLAAAGAATRIDGTPGPPGSRRLPAPAHGHPPSRRPGPVRTAAQRRRRTHRDPAHPADGRGGGRPAATVENITRLGTEVIPRLQC